MAMKISNERLKENLGMKGDKKKENPYLQMSLDDLGSFLENAENLDEETQELLIEAATIKMNEAEKNEEVNETNSSSTEVDTEPKPLVIDNKPVKILSSIESTEKKSKGRPRKSEAPQYTLESQSPINKNNETIINIIDNNIKEKNLMERTLDEWKNILPQECQVYRYKQQYVAKRYNEIRYKYTSLEEAKQIVKDNLYAILMFKYFKDNKDDDVYAKIDFIVTSLTKNLATFLIQITFSKEEDGFLMKELPDSCVAFTDGVFDFKKNDYLFKYDRIEIPKIHQTLIIYNDYIIDWSFTFPFDDTFKKLGVNIMELPFEDFVEALKELDKTDKNYCFELVYNMAHNREHKFSMERLHHLCQILGYTVIPSFQQYFVFFMGQGSNGKNSLIDGCFSYQVSPMPVSNSLTDIENDKFIGESLQNASHNFFLETQAKVYKDSSRLKALTGSSIQTIECKGVGKYQGRLNIKWLFAGNDVSEIKFADTTMGFRRRINIFQVYYTWDANKRFLKYGDRTYYDTTFSANLSQLKTRYNAMAYVYLAMYGIKEATNDFTDDFKFDYNEFDTSFNDIDTEITTLIENKINNSIIFNSNNLRTSSIMSADELRYAIYDKEKKKRVFESPLAHFYKIYNYPDFLEWLDKSTTQTVSDGDKDYDVEEPNYSLISKDGNVFYISLMYFKHLYAVVNGKEYKEQVKGQFNRSFKKCYPKAQYETLYMRMPYVKVMFVNDKITFPED